MRKIKIRRNPKMQKLTTAKARFAAWGPVQTVILFSTVLYRVSEVLVLGGTSAWLLVRNQDIISIGVGVSVGVWALAKLVNLAYRAETPAN
jgi:uncharacterized membrane protein (DUF485 family)